MYVRQGFLELLERRPYIFVRTAHKFSHIMLL